MTAYLSANADRQLKDYLVSCGCNLVLVYNPGIVSDPLSVHADVFYCLLRDHIYEGDKILLKAKYPGDVLYNAAAVGKYLVCSKHTSKDLIEESALKPIFVNQGYVKCNLTVVDDAHVITEDEGIYKTLSKYSDIECLLIEPRFVQLEGFDFGFIGGASGRVGDTLVFNGDLSLHPSYKKIADFIKSCNLEIKYFDSYPLTDIGSILVTT